MDNEILIRVGSFFGFFALMLGWESVAPRRAVGFSRKTRWSGNLGIALLNIVAARLLVPLVPVGFALLARERGWGLFNLLDLAAWLEIGAAFLLLDLAIYLQHVLFHAVRILWRVHRMHHTDLDYDVTTGLRFHPVETLISLVIKLAAVAVLGAAPLAVLIFEVVLNATSMFNHGNVRIDTSFDRGLRLFVVTPDMHRVHHSVIREETDSNYGFNLPWWDRLFGTYRPQPARGHEGMTLGLDRFRDPKMLRLHRLLAIPFIKTPPT